MWACAHAVVVIVSPWPRLRQYWALPGGEIEWCVCLHLLRGAVAPSDVVIEADACG